ncbi:hypothetical protein NC796_15730 [Aliifodinibius sp. S!AR15-10]|uniref:SMP-30/gluconolactonase/LRE family protein n=1 Tax=Aliifodinibius sp. S!AR15-10 TaxID=2950437 RepID=UPI00285A65D5|nr:hypothetical protein [Aliifodinibius sp. S!AR15-10]MDR8392606.1 hypothetical protein [Aliifodinibius sp. S!AR15-10]
MSKTRRSLIRNVVGTVVIAAILISCGGGDGQESSEAGGQASTIQDTTNVVASVTGLSGPESVRYDPDQDVYFVANFNGSNSDRDANGFISKIASDGTIQELQFMTGTEEAPMHVPRGMYITGDTLWAVDTDGVHGFNRMTGEQVTFVDFTSFEIGFLNDVVQGPDGALYVTDTFQPRLYKITNSIPTIVQDSLPYSPNGITISENGQHLILCPWNGVQTFRGWFPADSTLKELKTYSTGGNFDGVEIVNGNWVVSSQMDSTIKWGDETIIRTPGRPADIGIDTQRNHVAVPYIDLDRVDIWALPSE